MAAGDKAASAGLTVFTSDQDLREGYENDNVRGDELAEHILTGTHSADKITSGVFAPARIPTIPSSKVSGTFNEVQVPATQQLRVGAAGLSWDGLTWVTGQKLTSLGNIEAAGALRSIAAWAYNITTARRSVFMDENGYLGHQDSSRRFKTNINPADVDPEAILRIVAVLYEHKAEIARRDDPDAPDYIGPDYHVSTNFGVIAEQVAELGLWEVVYWDENGDPLGVHYDLLGLYAIVAAQHLQSRIDGLASRLDRLEGKV